MTKISFIETHDEGIDEIKELYEACYNKWSSDGIYIGMPLLPFALVGRKPNIEIIERYTGTNWQLFERLSELIKENENLTLNFSL